EERYRFGGPLWVHRVKTADGYERRVEVAQLRDKCHVTEDVGVPGEIDGVTVLEFDDEPAGLAAIDDMVPVRDPTRVLRVHQRHLDPIHIRCSALVGSNDGRSIDALGAKPRA